MRFVIVTLCCLAAPTCHAESFFDLVQELTGFGEQAKKPEEDPKLADATPEDDPIKAIALQEEDEFAPAPNIPTNGVILHGLDKETARVFAMTARVGEVVEFSTLKIKVHHCEMAPAEERPESAAFLTVTEERPGEPQQNLFNGWMFASSPALSALDHAVYDVWVKSCKTLD